MQISFSFKDRKHSQIGEGFFLKTPGNPMWRKKFNGTGVILEKKKSGEMKMAFPMKH